MTEQENQTKEAEQTKEDAKGKNWSSDIKKLGDKIVALTLMQAKELGDYLKEEYGIEPAAGGAVMMAGPAVQAQSEEKAEKTSFNVVLKEYGDKKIQVIKEVKSITGLGLKEAKELVDNLPKTIKDGLSKEDCRRSSGIELSGSMIHRLTVLNSGRKFRTTA
jgi:large subunit ribosomal protein L7/L12